MFIVRNQNYGFVVAYALASDAFTEARRLTLNSKGNHRYQVTYEPGLSTDVDGFDLVAHLEKRRD
jgi:hypothetical protein